MNENVPALIDQIKQNFWLRSPNHETRVLIFEYSLLAALIGLNPFANLFSFSLVLLGFLSFKMMRDIGKKWGYPKGQDILAIVGNLFGGLGALIMACLAWGFMIVAAIYFPVVKSLALAAAYSTFTWIIGQATNQYYATGKANEVRDSSLIEKPVGIASNLAGGGGSLQRRRVLLGLLATGTTITGIHSYVRLRQFNLEQVKLSKLALSSNAYVEQYLEQAFTSDTIGAQKTQAIKDSVKLIPPTVPYDRKMSKLLIRCTRLGTEQYLTGTIVTNYDGSIKSLPSFEPSLARYTQVATLIGPEEATTTRRLEVPTEETNSSILQPDPLRENLDQIEDVVKQLGGQVVAVKWLNPVYWGFVLRSSESSIISFRGTQQTNEWFQNVLAQQIRHTSLSPFEFVGKVHRGFFTLYSLIAQQVFEAAQKLDKSRPIYITGHSLGASLAILAAMDLAIRIPEIKNQLRLYTYAGPRIGNIEFAEAHSHLVPNHYRIVNVADSIPMAPPTKVDKLVFTHSGQLWTFVDYSGDLFLGHFVSVYKKAIDAEQEKLLNRRT
jgi:predicted lipase